MILQRIIFSKSDIKWTEIIEKEEVLHLMQLAENLLIVREGHDGSHVSLFSAMSAADKKKNQIILQRNIFLRSDLKNG